MPIQSAELVWRRAALTSDTTPAQNGGRMGQAAMADNAANNLWPNVTQTQRTAGMVRWRKDFLHVASAEDIALQAPRIYINTPTPGQDWHTFSPGTHTDTQDTHSPLHFGTATLQASIAAGATAISLVPENMASATALNVWRVGQLIRISAQPWDNDAANTTWATIASVTYGATTIDITLAAPGAAVAHAAGTLVSGVYEPGSIQASATTPVVTSATGGTCSAVAAPNKGSVFQNWTVTFTSPTAYTVAGDSLGTVGSGTTTSTTAPVNPACASPYFSLPSTAFGGTFAAGNTVTFSTLPAAVPLWMRNEIPAGCTSLAGNVVSRVVTGESA